MNSITHSLILSTLIKSDLTRAQELAILEIIQPEIIEGYQTKIAELEEEVARLRASEARLRNTTNEATERARVYQETNRTLLEQLHVRDQVMAKSLLDFVKTTNQTNIAIEQSKSLMLETPNQYSSLDTESVIPRMPPMLTDKNLAIPDYEYNEVYESSMDDKPVEYENSKTGGVSYAHEILSRHSRYSKSLGHSNNDNGNQ